MIYAHNNIKNRLKKLDNCNIDETNEYLEVKFDNKLVDNNTRIYSISGSATKPDLIIDKFTRSVQDNMKPAFVMSSVNDQVSYGVKNIQSILKDPFISHSYLDNRIRLYKSSSVLSYRNFNVLEPKDHSYYWSIPKNRSRRQNYIRYKERSTDEELFKIQLKKNDNQSYNISRKQFPYTVEYNEDKSVYTVNTPDNNYNYDNIKTLMNEFKYVHEPVHSYLYDVEKYHNAVDNVMFFIVHNDSLYKTKIQTYQKYN